MNAFYDLWDVDSGNSLGTYETEAGALTVVQTLIRAYGEDYAEVLDLGYQDSEGEWQAIATGRALVGRVMALVGDQARVAGIP